MIDKRWYQLADILVNYSTMVRAGERVLITMMEIETFPLARTVYSEVVKAGGLPYVEFQSAYLDRDLMKLGNTEQVKWICEMQAKGMEWADAYIGLRGARNPNEFLDIDAKKIANHKQSMGKISSMRNDLTRWVLIRVPNESFAQQASTSFDEMMTFFFIEIVSPTHLVIPMPAFRTHASRVPAQIVSAHGAAAGASSIVGADRLWVERQEQMANPRDDPGKNKRVDEQAKPQRND